MISTTPTRYFMCPPVHFAVDYCINPWMDPGCDVDVERALRQWRRLRDQLVTLGHVVDVVQPHPGLPDMVFAANGGIVIGTRALIPRFRHAERAGESMRFAAAFRAAGLDVQQAENINEGEGDFLFTGDRILAGVGLRSELDAIDEVADYFRLPVVALTLVDPRFYHLDTALAVLDSRTVVYWPGAFDEASAALLRVLYPDAIEASEQDAATLGLNMVSDGSSVILAPGCDELEAQIRDRGFATISLATDELRKAGGGAKCCVLEWHAAPAAVAAA